MGNNASVSLGDYFEDFVESEIVEGRYKNASEVICAGLRLLEDKEKRIMALKKAIQEGTDSGIAHDFDRRAFLEKWKAERKDYAKVSIDQ